MNGVPATMYVILYIKDRKRAARTDGRLGFTIGAKPGRN